MSEPRRIVFVSYWTAKYQKAAERLKASLDALGLESDIREVEDRGWHQNVSHKPTFILEMLKAHPEAYAVVWVDADGDVVKRPELFWKIDEDMCARYMEWRFKKKEELLSGTMYWRNSEQVHAQMAKWIAAMAAGRGQNRSCPEQQVLQEMIQEKEVELSVHRMPEEYCHILRDRGRSGVPDDKVIVHYQFSRDTRYDRDPSRALSEPSKGERLKGLKAEMGARADRRRRLREKAIALKKKKAIKAGKREPPPEVGKVPSSIIQARRRKEIQALRGKTHEETMQRIKQQKAIALAAGLRNRIDKIKKLEEELRGPRAKPKVLALATGGVKGSRPSDRDVLLYQYSRKSVLPAARLDRMLPHTQTTVWVLGNSPTLKDVPIEQLRRIPSVGCNRALMWDDFWPNVLVIGDREPYCQERDAGRLEEAARRGTRLVLADSLFDPRVCLRGPFNNPNRRAQVIPSWPFYMYDIGPKKKKWDYSDIARGAVTLPVNSRTFSKPIVSCLNIAGSMLQTAAIIGARRIACVGIEMKWKSDEESHFFGNGTKYGCYSQEPSMDLIQAALVQLRDQFKADGIEIINVSPVPRTPFSEVFGKYPVEKFFQEIALLPPWDPLDVFNQGEPSTSEVYDGEKL